MESNNKINTTKNGAIESNMRIRIGNYVAGINSNKTEHALFGRFMIGRVADTIGVLNSIKGSDEQMFFADFDVGGVMNPDHKEEIDQQNINLIEHQLSLEPLSDFLIFRSIIPNSSDHFFVISPFRYDKRTIRLTLADLCGLIDPKFVAVYMRDGVNAIRLIPKSVGNNQTRKIEFVKLVRMNRTRKAVEGMLLILIDKFCLPIPIWSNWDCDDTNPEDITTREYETIRW